MKKNGRKLSESEQRRKNAFDLKIKSFEQQGFQRKNLIIDMHKANIYTIIIMIPISICLIVVFQFLNQQELCFQLTLYNIINYVFVLAIMVVLHELIHGITWSFFTKKSF